LITIRKATFEDKYKIQEVINNTDFAQFCPANLTEHTLVVELENTIVGCGNLDIIEDLALIKFVYIIPKYRNQGLGDGLVRALINYADRRNVKKIYIICDDKSEYFKRFGFKYVAATKCNRKVYESHSRNIKDQFIMELDVDEFFNSCHCH